ncbi:hypothetical protein TRIP_C60349 [Candidatus Zixiibacteriota bacterium]|nr:hypothetical protein TRIP_C60349 [candidate division Zixibacteria bacterium]
MGHFIPSVIKPRQLRQNISDDAVALSQQEEQIRWEPESIYWSQIRQTVG